MVASLLKSKSRVRYKVRVPLNKPIGKTSYVVQSTIEPVTFYKRKDAKLLKELLNKAATQNYKADIIRREVTDEGYIPTYPEGRK